MFKRVLWVAESCVGAGVFREEVGRKNYSTVVLLTFSVLTLILFYPNTIVKWITILLYLSLRYNMNKGRN